jgi:hypothetical protein
MHLWALVLACAALPLGSEPVPSPGFPPESPVQVLELSGPLARSDAEVSGLAWRQDQLFLLPQYPDFSTTGDKTGDDGFVYTLSRGEVEEAIAHGTPLVPRAIPFSAPGTTEIAGFEGFEAITFLHGVPYLTIESGLDGVGLGFLVAGILEPDFSAFHVDLERRAPIPSASGVTNLSEEALLVAGDELVLFHEANGAALVAKPVAKRFHSNLTPAGETPMPPLEFRVTDVTELDQDGAFWALNFHYPGDLKLKTETDPLAEAWGRGRTHTRSGRTERLVPLQWNHAGITLQDRAPIQLQLPKPKNPMAARNWEGVVRMGDGFLLVTDKYPSTQLAWVPR